jgi:hypothetical protein
MSLILDKDESFSMSAYVESPGYQRVLLSGYLLERRADGAYVAPLIPQLFYGVNGTQLQTWQQYLSTVGNQVILSRSGGQPSVPREDLYWRKIESKTENVQQPQIQPATAKMELPNYTAPLLLIGGTLIAIVAYYLLKK